MEHTQEKSAMADVKHTPTEYKALGLGLLAKAKAQVADSDAASNEAFDNTFHKIAADVSRDRWNKIWRMAAQWQRYYTIRTHGHALKKQRDELLEALREVLNLCAIGDVDEETEALGWGKAIKRANKAIAKATGAARATEGSV